MTEAEILLGATMWLARFRDWLTEELDLAPSAPGSEAATIILRRANAQAFRDGLGRTVSLIDGLTVDPEQVRPRTEIDATPAGGRTLQ